MSGYYGETAVMPFLYAVCDYRRADSGGLDTGFFMDLQEKASWNN